MLPAIITEPEVTDSKLGEMPSVKMPLRWKPYRVNGRNLCAS